jgi:HSP20 family protein
MTTMVRWSPFLELEQLERRMRRMFDDTGLWAGRLPAADLYETDDAFVLEMEAPGFAEKEIAVDVTDHTVRVKGERKEEKEKKEKTFFLHERLESTFERRFALPDGVDAGKLAATFKDGVLKVSAPKMPIEPTKAIPITKG